MKLGLVLAFVALLAQGREPAPTCNMCPGTYIPNSEIDDHITYLMVRVDPDKVTPHKTEADSKADLATDGRATAGGGAGAASSPERDRR